MCPLILLALKHATKAPRIAPERAHAPTLGYPTASPTSPSTGLTERHSTNLISPINLQKPHIIPLDIIHQNPHNTPTPTTRVFKMSAFICSDLHIQTIAVYAERMGDHLKAQAIADILKKENIKSVNYRYNEKTRFTKTKFTTDNLVYCNSADVFQLVSCLMYQSCEHPEYDGSPAQIIAAMIKEHAAQRMHHQSSVWSI